MSGQILKNRNTSFSGRWTNEKGIIFDSGRHIGWSHLHWPQLRCRLVFRPFVLWRRRILAEFRHFSMGVYVICYCRICSWIPLWSVEKYQLQGTNTRSLTKKQLTSKQNVLLSLKRVNDGKAAQEQVSIRVNVTVLLVFSCTLTAS